MGVVVFVVKSWMYKENKRKSLVRMLYGPHNAEDPGTFIPGSRFFWLHVPLSNFHKNERGPASDAVSSSLYTSMFQSFFIFGQKCPPYSDSSFSYVTICCFCYMKVNWTSQGFSDKTSKLQTFLWPLRSCRKCNFFQYFSTWYSRVILGF